ncbi:MFS transporter [Paraburkholderia sp. J63]|uniref:MFS transporter n=1 Tax=Paraburkholderia sp. J63 TaxID=2805434 RepID=UPI002ABE0579|nr:MFS transporter [Paraburkholderia sp. J63]
MKEKWSSYENVLVVLLFMSIGFVFFDRLAINFLFPFMRADFGLSHTQMGMLSSVLAFTWAATGYFLGQYSEAKSKRKVVLVTSVVVFSLCSVASGLAQSFMMLMIVRAVMGLAEGPTLPISQSLMAIESSEKRRGFNMGFIQASAAGLFGSVLGPALIVPLAMHFGWRTAFYVVGIPGLLLAALLSRFVREPAARTARINLSTAEKKPRFREVLGYRNVWICILISCAFITWYYAFLAFAPSYLIEQRHFAPSQMAWIMSLIGLANVIGGFGVPALSDRLGRKSMMIIFSVASILTPLVLIFFHAAFPLFALVLFLTYLGHGCFPLFMATIPSETVPAACLTRTIGLVIGVGEIVGGFVSPTIAGSAADHFGAAAPFYMAAGAATLAAVLSLFLQETAPCKRVAVGTEPKSFNQPI